MPKQLSSNTQINQSTTQCLVMRNRFYFCQVQLFHQFVYNLQFIIKIYQSFKTQINFFLIHHKIFIFKPKVLLQWTNFITLVRSMSNINQPNDEIPPSEESHSSQFNEAYSHNNSSNAEQSNHAHEKFANCKFEQNSKNQSQLSEYSQQQSERGMKEEHQQQKHLIGKDIITFQKNNPNNQRFQNKLQCSKEKQPQVHSSYPWLNERTLVIQNPLIKLHNQVIDYFLEFQEEEQTHNHLLFTFNKLQGLLFKSFKNCDVLAPFLTNRVYLKSSQIQVFILFDVSSWKNLQTIQKVKECLEKNNMEQIKYFQVPIQEGKQQKIGFNCVSPEKKYPIQIKLVTHQWLSYLSMISDVLENNLQSKYLYLVFDTMIRQRGMQNAVKGYFLFGLISVFIHERKRQRSRSLTENVLKFLQYFGIGPFTERKIIYVGKNEFEINMEPAQGNSMGGQFSFWIGPNIDISSHMARQFFSILRNRYRLISNFNFAGSPSILAALLNPTSDQFRY